MTKITSLLYKIAAEDHLPRTQTTARWCANAQAHAAAIIPLSGCTAGGLPRSRFVVGGLSGRFCATRRLPRRFRAMLVLFFFVISNAGTASFTMSFKRNLMSQKLLRSKKKEGPAWLIRERRSSELIAQNECCSHII